ncbi:MAG: hypothetical protein JXR77_17135, partial [Lentisphaeria bacterium]|nr:hypothetical protein [Lentisphaeria bacterium]
TITDECQNPATATQVITVDDTQAPTVPTPLPAVSVQCAEDVPAAVTTIAAFEAAFGNVTDNCSADGDLSISHNDTALTDACGGTITRTYTITDECQNPATAIQVITVDDTQAPTVPQSPLPPVTVQCPTDVPAAVTTIAAFEAAFGAVSDNCSDDADLVLTHSDTPLTDPCGGSIFRMYIITDECQNSASASQTITVDDTTAPTVVCPADILDPQIQCVDDLLNPLPPLATSWAAFTGQGGSANDNCGVDETSFLSEQIIVDVGNYNPAAWYATWIPQPPTGCQEYYVRTYSVADDCQNRGQCVQVILVEDTIPPVVAVDTATLPFCFPSEVDAIAAIAGRTTATDNCTDSMTPSVMIVPVAGSPCLRTFTVTVTDECGNSDTYDSVDDQLTIRIDDQGPVGQPGDIDECYANDAAAIADAEAEVLVAVYDECGGDVTIIRTTVEPDVAGGPCDVIVTVNVADICGNESEFQFMTRIDNVGPVCLLDPITVTLQPGPGGNSYSLTPADILAILGASYDACGGPVDIVVSQTEFDCEDIGPNTIDVELTDVCGNSVTCQVVITVVDFVTVTVGTGYTFLYPSENCGEQRYILAGPGNWVTVPISACHCEPLQQLVFVLYFDYMAMEYMWGMEEWDKNRVLVDGPFAHPDWVNIEVGVSGDGMGMVVVTIDSPTAEPVILTGCDEFMSLKFRIRDDHDFFEYSMIWPEVWWATGENGIEIGRAGIPGGIYIDQCNWLLDMDRNGQYQPHIDGVILYRSIKYGDCFFGLVPLIPPDYEAAFGAYLPEEWRILDYTYWLEGNFDLNVDDKDDALGCDIGAPRTSASRDIAYIVRNGSAYPGYRYPPYACGSPYTPFLNPMVPPGSTLTVPVGHTDNYGVAEQDAINGEIDLLKILWCPYLLNIIPLPKGGVMLPEGILPLDPATPLPCWWMVAPPVKNSVDPTTLPLTQVPWDPCYNYQPPNGGVY